MRSVTVFACLIACCVHYAAASCTPPDHNPNSYYLPVRSSYPVNSVVRYYCRSCYSGIRGFRSCRASYKSGYLTYGWTSSAPHCVCSTTAAPPTAQDPTHCTRPQDPPHGVVTSTPANKQRFYVGDFVTYSCYPRFQLQGPAHVVCRVGGWSFSSTCVARTTARPTTTTPASYSGCSRPADPHHGSIHSSKPRNSRYDVGEWVIYRCDEDYCLNGDSSVYCQEYGWGHSPTCNHGCAHREAPVYGGQVGHKESWCPGDNVTYTCDHGYHLHGHATASCGDYATWDYAVPSCQYVCHRPSDPDYGSMTSDPSTKSEFYVGDYVMYSCRRGYRLHGNPQVQCRYGGWSHTPTCRAVCERPHVPDCGSIVSTPPNKELYYNNDYITYRCNHGCCLYGDAKVYCRNGQWSHTPRCRPTCRHRDAPQYGSQVGSKSYWCPGDSADYACQHGYELHGHSSSSCGDGWNNDVPVCRPVCDRPSNPHYGSVSSTPRNKRVFYDGDSMTYSCNTGYCLYGDPTVYCRHRVWSHTPTCSQACSTRDAPEYGSYEPHKPHYCPGDHVNYACNHYYALHGDGNATCRHNTGWDNDVPRCRYQCHRPDDPHYGRVRPASRQTFYEGQYVTIKCNDGYCLHGNPKVYCRHGHGWGPSPVCRYGCPPRRAPHHGSQVGGKSHYCPGDTDTYECDDGYVIDGHAMSTCGDDYSWNFGVPLCRSATTHAHYTTSRPRYTTTRPHYTTTRPHYTTTRPHYTNTRPRASCSNDKCGVINAGGCSCASDCARYRDCCDDYNQYCGGGTGGGGGSTRCPHVTPPVNGSYQPGYKTIWNAGDVVTYSCDSGYTMNGYASSRCGQGGRWSSPPPTCRRCFFSRC